MKFNNNFNYTKDNEKLIDTLPKQSNDQVIVKSVDDIVDDLVDISLDDILELLDDSLQLKEVNQKVYKKFVDKYGKKKAKAIYYATANKQGRDPETWEFTKKTNEENVSGNVAGYNTPKAFISATEEELEDKFDYEKYYGEKAPKISPDLKGDNKYKKLKTENVDKEIKTSMNDLIDELNESFNVFNKLVKSAVKYKNDKQLSQEDIGSSQLTKINNLKVEIIKVEMLLNNLRS